MPAQTGSVLGTPSPSSMRMAAVPGTLCFEGIDGAGSASFINTHAHKKKKHNTQRHARVEVPAEHEQGPSAVLRLHDVLPALHLLEEGVRLN